MCCVGRVEIQYESKYKKVGVLLIQIVKSNVSSIVLRQRETGIVIILCLTVTLDNFTHQGRTSRRERVNWTSLSTVSFKQNNLSYKTKRIHIFSPKGNLSTVLVLYTMPVWAFSHLQDGVNSRRDESCSLRLTSAKTLQLF